jgi:hypothetical protein
MAVMTALRPGPASLDAVFRSLTGRGINKTFAGNFETRLVFQKTMYLLGAARAVKPSFSFGLHLYGPYSSSWAKRAYATSAGTPFSVEITDRITNAETLISGKSTGDLVALATLHYFHRRLGLSRQEAHDKAEVDGKLTVLKHFDTAWDELEAANWLS